MSALPSAIGKAGQKLLGNAAENGSKVQAFAGNVLARGSGSAPNAIGAVQTYQAYEAYQNGEGSLTEVLKAGVYTAAPFAVGRMGRGKPSAPHGKTQAAEPHTPSTVEKSAPQTTGRSDPQDRDIEPPTSTQRETGNVGNNSAKAPKDADSGASTSKAPQDKDPVPTNTDKKPPKDETLAESRRQAQSTQDKEPVSPSGDPWLDSKGYRPQPGERTTTRTEYRTQESARRNFPCVHVEQNPESLNADRNLSPG